MTLGFSIDLQIGKKYITQIVGEEVNLSTFKWNYLNFFHLLLNSMEDIREVKYQKSFIWEKKISGHNDKKEKLCLQLAPDSGSGRCGVCFPPS